MTPWIVLHSVRLALQIVGKVWAVVNGATRQRNKLIIIYYGVFVDDSFDFMVMYSITSQ